MEELIAKSKAFRAEKMKQREEDLDATEALDEQFGLLQNDILPRLMKTKGSRKSAPAQEVQAFSGARSLALLRLWRSACPGLSCVSQLAVTSGRYQNLAINVAGCGWAVRHHAAGAGSGSQS